MDVRRLRWSRRLKKAGEVSSRVTMYVADPVFGDKADKAPQWRKVTRSITLPPGARLSSVTGCSDRSDAAMMGSAAFLLPDGRMEPESVAPPSTMN